MSRSWLSVSWIFYSKLRLPFCERQANHIPGSTKFVLNTSWLPEPILAQCTKGYLAFSGDIEVEYKAKMGEVENKFKHRKLT